MAGMAIDKLTPVIDESFLDTHLLQIVNGRAVERGDVMCLVAVATVKKSIFNHGLYPSRQFNRTTERKGRATSPAAPERPQVPSFKEIPRPGGPFRQAQQRTRCLF
jgi:hypothetical protein